MNETIIRVYTGNIKTIKKADWRINQSGYYEIGYKEFDAETGELVGEGTADFSSARMRGELKRYDVQAYSGRRQNDRDHRSDFRQQEPEVSRDKSGTAYVR